MNERIQARLADLKARQLAGENLSCPRCGRKTMKDEIHTNALSRHADIYVCDQCGTDEAMLKFMRNPLSIEDWSCVQKRFDEYLPETIEEHIDVITHEHIPFLTTLYQRWLDKSKPTAAYELTSRLFMRAILNQTGWDANCSYRLNGRYSEELGVVSFDMNHLEKIDAMPPQYQES